MAVDLDIKDLDLALRSPMACWLVTGPRHVARPEVTAFCDWLLAQATLTRTAIGDAHQLETIEKPE